MVSSTLYKWQLLSAMVFRIGVWVAITNVSLFYYLWRMLNKIDFLYQSTVCDLFIASDNMWLRQWKTLYLFAWYSAISVSQTIYIQVQHVSNTMITTVTLAKNHMNRRLPWNLTIGTMCHYSCCVFNVNKIINTWAFLLVDARQNTGFLTC